MNINQKLNGGFLAVVLIPMVAVLLANQNAMKESISGFYKESLKASINKIAVDDLHVMENGARNYMHFLSKDGRVIKSAYYATNIGNSEDMETILKEAKQAFGISFLEFMDMSGNVVFSTSPERSKMNFSSDAFFKTASGDVQHTGLFFDPTLMKFRVQSAVLIKRHDQPIGLLQGGYLLDKNRLQSLAGNLNVFIARGATDVKRVGENTEKNKTAPEESPSVTSQEEKTSEETDWDISQIEMSFAQDVFSRVDMACKEDLKSENCSTLQVNNASKVIHGKDYLLVATPLRMSASTPFGILILAKEASQMVEDTAKARNMGIVMTIAFSLMAIMLGLFITRTIVLPLRRSVDIANRMAEGHLIQFQYQTKKSEDETSKLLASMSNMVANFREMVGLVVDSTKQVHNSAKEISNTVHDEVAIATEQASAVSEITASMEELSSTSVQIAENVNSVLEIAENTLSETEQGRSGIKMVMAKIEEIDHDNQKNIEEIVELGEKSQEITNIMEMINTIADQTKLIAFNAAIEASSAGDAGTRFGVVAVEIRRLANNVMESTREIKNNLREIQKSVNRLVITSEKGSKGIQEGKALTSETVEILTNIVHGAKISSDKAKQIALSTQQQKTATTQVVVSLKDIETGSQQITSSLNQTNDICKTLTDLSDELTRHVGRFRLD